MELLGQQLGKYELVKHIGHGGYADVYCGKHHRLQSLVAIKVLKSAEISPKEEEVFLKEARMLIRLIHPHIIHVIDCGIWQEPDGLQRRIPYIVMTYAPLGNLRSIYPEGERVPVDRIMLYVRQMASALQFAHDQPNNSIVHCDVKPENMLLVASDDLRLSDFGIAKDHHNTVEVKHLQDASKGSIKIFGTPGYMPPERCLNGQISRAGDQYSLAVVVYEWLTGLRPFDGDSLAVMTKHACEDPPLMRVRFPKLNISQEVEDVVMKALSKDTGQRYPRIADFALALEQALTAQQARQGVSTIESIEAQPTQPPSRLQKNPRLSAVKAAPGTGNSSSGTVAASGTAASTPAAIAAPGTADDPSEAHAVPGAGGPSLAAKATAGAGGAPASGASKAGGPSPAAAGMAPGAGGVSSGTKAASGGAGSSASGKRAPGAGSSSSGTSAASGAGGSSAGTRATPGGPSSSGKRAPGAGGSSPGTKATPGAGGPSSSGPKAASGAGGSQQRQTFAGARPATGSWSPTATTVNARPLSRSARKPGSVSGFEDFRAVWALRPFYALSDWLSTFGWLRRESPSEFTQRPRSLFPLANQGLIFLLTFLLLFTAFPFSLAFFIIGFFVLQLLRWAKDLHYASAANIFLGLISLYYGIGVGLICDKIASWFPHAASLQAILFVLPILVLGLSIYRNYRYVRLMLKP